MILGHAMLIWIITVLMSFGVTFSVVLKFIKNVTDAGYKIDMLKLSQIDEPGEFDNFYDFKMHTFLIPIYNILKSFELITLFNNMENNYLDALDIMGVLEEMTDKEKRRISKKSTALMAFSIILNMNINEKKIIKTKLSDKINKLEETLNTLSHENDEQTENLEILDEENLEIRNNNISKIEINDYISLTEYAKIIETMDDPELFDLISNQVLWNSVIQKVNKGTYYVITTNDYLYNILINDEMIKIDERTTKEIDEHTKKEDIVEEKVITFNKNNNEYKYFSAKHDKSGDTFYTKYYYKDKTIHVGILELTEEDAFKEIETIFCNLGCIEGIENILDIDLLKKDILDDLKSKKLIRKK